MKEYYMTKPDEQETNISIDYKEKKVSFYTNRKTQMERLTKKLGKPTKTYYTENKICGAVWDLSFGDKKNINFVMSRPTLIDRL